MEGTDAQICTAVLPWVVRVAWLVVPFSVGTAVADALDGRSAPVQVTAAALLWVGWAVVVGALLVPRPVGLVLARCGAAGALLAALVATDEPIDLAIGVTPAIAVLVVLLLPAVGEWFVNGAAYGYERRYLLRAPAPVLVGPLVFAGLLVPVSLVIGPLLVAARQWVIGALVTAVGGALAYVLGRALHSMTQRWAVLVPAGLVLKDHLALLDPVLFRRVDVESLRRAPADTDALDLTAGALGLALELDLRSPQHVDRMRPVRRSAEPFEARRLLFTPTRPAALLADAASRRFRVVDQVATPPPSTSSPS